MIQESKSILISQFRNRARLYLIEHVTRKYQEEIKYNISQYIKAIESTSVKIETSKPDLEKFVYRAEYIFNNLGVKLSDQEGEQIVNAIKKKYLSIYGSESSKRYASFYISRPSKDIWQISTKTNSKNPWLLSKMSEDATEELFIDFIIEKISQI